MPLEHIIGCLVTQDASVQDAAGAIQNGGKQICLLVNESNHLIGSVTDGDLRRGLLAGVQVHAPASMIMNKSPVSAFIGTAPEVLLEIIKTNDIQQIPLIDKSGQVTNIIH